MGEKEGNNSRIGWESFRHYSSIILSLCEGRQLRFRRFLPWNNSAAPLNLNGGGVVSSWHQCPSLGLLFTGKTARAYMIMKLDIRTREIGWYTGT